MGNSKNNQQINNTNPLQNPKFQPEVMETEELTLGQKVADKMANQVGSWPFLIAQTGILAGWVGLNMMPGVPHWDAQPFMLLNLVFSFASAYTAPVVLMSQNRQSDTDRKNALDNHRVNINTGHNVQLLQEKMDSLHAQHIEKLTQIIAQQQESLQELKTTLSPNLPAENTSLKVVPFSTVPSQSQTKTILFHQHHQASNHVKKSPNSGQ